MESDDLLSQADEPAREQLRRLGWVMLPMHGGTVWRSPQNILFTEEEALKFLDSHPNRD